MRRECEARIVVHAPAEAVWGVISDVTRVGAWSGECQGCEWVGSVTEPRPGARFKGRNRRGGMRWTRLSEIDVADPPKELTWHTIFAGVYRDSTQWRLTLLPAPEGTEVIETFRILKMSNLTERLLGLLQPAHRDRSDDLAGDLARLKGVVESNHLST